MSDHRREEAQRLARRLRRLRKHLAAERARRLKRIAYGRAQRARAEAKQNCMTASGDV
jgi:hypothetical protein